MTEEQIVKEEESAKQDTDQGCLTEPLDTSCETVERETDTVAKTSEEQETKKAPAKRRSFRSVCIVAVAIVLVVALGVGLSLKLSAPEREEEATRSGEFLLGTVVDTAEAEYSYEEMKADLYALQEAYPNLIRVSSAGKTLDGREIYYADLGSPDAKKQIFISAGIHGREYLTPMLLMKMTEYYLTNYHVEDEQGVAYADLGGEVLIRVVPMVNPDGIMISQEGLSAIRSEALREKIGEVYRSDCSKYESYRQYGSLEEYLKHGKANAAGVDLNRNFPIEYWEEMRTGIGQPSAQAYKGPAAASEPETRAMMALIETLSNPVCVVSIHSQGEILYWNCGQEGELLKKNEALRDRVVELTGYRPQDTFSHPDATLDDWAALQRGIPSLNMETGKGSCPLPVSQFGTIWEQTKDLFVTLLDWDT